MWLFLMLAGSTFPRSSLAPDGNGGFASDVFAFGIVLYQMLATYVKCRWFDSSCSRMPQCMYDDALRL